jgi:deferrochelatase/peroxidase EfeB
VSDDVLHDVQGWVLRGYNLATVRHVALAVRDRSAAKSWLREALPSGSSQYRIQTAQRWATKPEITVNVAFTFAGLAAMGVPKRTLDQFPTDFREGMAARHVKIGDIGDSDPSRWMDPYRSPDAVHVIVTIHALRAADLEVVTDSIPASAFDRLGVHDGAAHPGDLVHFGYRDNISQPRFELTHPDRRDWDDQPYAQLGMALLGHETDFEGLRWNVPDHIGTNGSYNAFRILRQDTSGFDEYLEESAHVLASHPSAEQLLPAGAEEHFGANVSRHEAFVEIAAAKLLGRWRNGNSLVTDPHVPGPPRPLEELSLFDYVDDEDGQRCPIGSHVRRNNPRGAKIVQRYASHTRRIIRRGMPYGPFDGPGERGLLGVFIGASLSAQFEALQNDWMNLGLQDPRITGTNDPLLGTNDPLTSVHAIPVGDDVIELRGFPRFVTTLGGAYTFIPGIAALGRIAS